MPVYDLWVYKTTLGGFAICEFDLWPHYRLAPQGRSRVHYVLLEYVHWMQDQEVTRPGLDSFTFVIREKMADSIIGELLVILQSPDSVRKLSMTESLLSEHFGMICSAEHQGI